MSETSGKDRVCVLDTHGRPLRCLGVMARSPPHWSLLPGGQGKQQRLIGWGWVTHPPRARGGGPKGLTSGPLQLWPLGPACDRAPEDSRWRGRRGGKGPGTQMGTLRVSPGAGRWLPKLDVVSVLEQEELWAVEDGAPRGVCPVRGDPCRAGRPHSPHLFSHSSEQTDYSVF